MKKNPSLLSTLFPPSPPFTDKNLPSLVGRVFIITGAASGVGYELAKILYTAGGTVYIGARSSSRCKGAITKIESEVKTKPVGRLESLVVDLSDLKTVKPAVEEFMGKEERLDVLWHNAAVMSAPVGSRDKQGHDLEVGTNCLCPYLLTLLLEPLLVKTAQMPGMTAGSVRTVWVTSALNVGGHPKGGMILDGNGAPVYQSGTMTNYMQSKVGMAFLADRCAKRMGDRGILHITLHPGLMLTELQRHWPRPQRAIMGLMFKPPIYGAYSELYAGFSPEVTMEHNGGHTMAWGRLANLPDELSAGLKSEKEGGSGLAQKFYGYCDREIRNFL